MERSHIFHQCVRKVLRNSTDSRALQTYRQYTPSIHLRVPTPTQCFRRGLSFSCKRLENSSNQTKAPGKGQENVTSTGPSGGPARQSSSRSQFGPSRQNRPHRQNRYPGDENRIDLSTIPGIPSNYRAPNRPDEETAQAKLRTLLGAAAQQPSAAFRNKQSTGDSATASSSRTGDVDTMSGSHLDAYTSPFPNQYAQSVPNLDIAELIANIDRPNGSNSSGSGLDFLSNTVNKQPVETLRLRTTLGRTVAVTPSTGFDLTRAFRQLDLKCNSNNVRRDEIKQRFHVRRGQRKKLERRMRWRVLFKEGFLAECARIRRMRAQGW